MHRARAEPRQGDDAGHERSRGREISAAGDLAAFFVERDTAATLALFRQNLGANTTPTQVRFAHAAPADTRVYEKFFGCPVRFNDDASQGQLKVVEPGRPSTELWFQLCTVRVDRRALLATYDPTSPECQGPKSGHRELRGMIGEQTAWGELWQADKKIGFFRAFREPPAEPTAASTSNP